MLEFSSTVQSIHTKCGNDTLSPAGKTSFDNHQPDIRVTERGNDVNDISVFRTYEDVNCLNMKIL